MTHYTIYAAAQELGVTPLLLRLVLITHGISFETDTITEDQLEQIKPTLYRMKGSYYYDDANVD